jgi:hypothetical protein
VLSLLPESLHLKAAKGIVTAAAIGTRHSEPVRELIVA